MPNDDMRNLRESGGEKKERKQLKSMFQVREITYIHVYTCTLHDINNYYCVSIHRLIIVLCV